MKLIFFYIFCLRSVSVVVMRLGRLSDVSNVGFAAKYFH